MSDELKNEQEEHNEKTPESAPQDSPKEPEEQYSFLQETIKDEQKSGKKVFGAIWRVAGRGLIFGVAACVAFCVLKPWLETKLNGNPGEVTIPKDENTDEEDAADADKDAQTEEEPVQPALTIESYHAMSRELYQVAVTASKSVVEVTGTKGDESWEDASFDNKNSVSGVICADNGVELLILSPARVTKDAQTLSVMFTDNQTYAATVKKQDKNLGIAVISVARSEISDSTWGQVQVATLGNSNIVNRGDSVISLGKQFGYAGGLGYGVISSVRNKVAAADGEYRLLTTDIGAVEEGSGILFNLNGEVIGLEDQTISDGSSQAFTTAYAISDMKEYIERLSNGKAVSYLGVRGVEVTDDISEQQQIPKGIYVKEVEADSPAMKAGIQSGDVITAIGKNKVATLSGYGKQLLEYEVGEQVRVYGQRQGSSGYIDIDFSVTIGSRE